MNWYIRYKHAQTRPDPRVVNRQEERVSVPISLDPANPENLTNVPVTVETQQVNPNASNNTNNPPGIARSLLNTTVRTPIETLRGVFQGFNDGFFRSLGKMFHPLDLMAATVYRQYVGMPLPGPYSRSHTRPNPKNEQRALDAWHQLPGTSGSNMLDFKRRVANAQQSNMRRGSGIIPKLVSMTPFINSAIIYSLLSGKMSVTDAVSRSLLGNSGLSNINGSQGILPNTSSMNNTMI